MDSDGRKRLEVARREEKDLNGRRFMARTAREQDLLTWQINRLRREIAALEAKEREEQGT